MKHKSKYNYVVLSQDIILKTYNRERTAIIALSALKQLEYKFGYILNLKIERIPRKLNIAEMLGEEE